MLEQHQQDQQQQQHQTPMPGCLCLMQHQQDQQQQQHQTPMPGRMGSLLMQDNTKGANLWESETQKKKSAPRGSKGPERTVLEKQKPSKSCKEKAAAKRGTRNHTLE